MYSPEWVVNKRLRSIGKLKSSEEADGEDDCGDDVNSAHFSLCVGRFCCVRLLLYHAMTHFKWAIVNRLKEEISKMREVKCGSGLDLSAEVMVVLRCHVLMEYVG